MASIKLALDVENDFIITHLNNLANSQTVGWQSDAVDNSTNLYLDALVQVIIDFANTAPANDQAAYVYAYAALSCAYTNPATGAEGCLTITNPATMKLIGVLPYNTADEQVESSPMSVAAAFGGILPTKWGIVVINYSGAAIAATGNRASWRGVYNTVA